MSQLDFFDYVSGITIGSIGAEMATELDEPYKPLIALILWGGASLLLNLITTKFPSARRYINGAPTILMHRDTIYRKNLKKARLDLSEFMLMCREAGYFDLSEIQTAVFEHNGKLSILPKSAHRAVTPDDLKIPASATHIGVELILDGRIMSENLGRIGKDKRWLMSKLKLQGYEFQDEIFLAIYRTEEDALTLYPMR